MTEEIMNLETAKPIGVVESLFEGLSKFFGNFEEIVKMCKPILITSLGVLLALTPAFLIAGKSMFLAISVGILISLVGFGFIFYGFWQFLLGFIGVSYLAKDIYENKPTKTVEEYFGYVKAHSCSYVKLLLWIVLGQFGPLCLVFTIAGAMIAFIQSTKAYALFALLFLAIIVVFILLIPYYWALSMAPIFWAYQEKTDSIAVIKSAFNAVCKSFWPFFGYQIILAILLQVASTIVQFAISIPVMLMGIQTSQAPNIGSVIAFAFIFMAITIYTLFISYALSFINTRCYFELIKK